MSNIIVSEEQVKNARSFVFYAKEDRKEAILTYEMEVKVNGSKVEHFKKGDKITLLGEFVINAVGEHKTRILEQYIFTNGVSVDTIWKEHVALEPTLDELLQKLAETPAHFEKAQKALIDKIKTKVGR